MRCPSKSLPAALAMALVLGAPRSGSACFDEEITRVGPVRIASTFYSENSALLLCGQRGTPCATWAARLARLLPRGARLEVRSGWEVTQKAGNDVEFELCLPRRGCRLTVSEHGEIGGVFDEVAARLGTPRARRARIRRIRPAYFTLQAGAFARKETAEALARTIDDGTGGLGAKVTQGHPGPTQAAWVEEATVGAGRRVYRVMAGTFAGRAYAVQARARVAAETGERPLIRPLGADGD